MERHGEKKTGKERLWKEKTFFNLGGGGGGRADEEEQTCSTADGTVGQRGRPVIHFGIQQPRQRFKKGMHLKDNDASPVPVRVYGYRGYPPEQLRQLSLQQRYHDGEADAGRDQVQQGGLWTDGSLWTHQTDTSNLTPDDGFTCACLKVCMTKMVRPSPKM